MVTLLVRNCAWLETNVSAKAAGFRSGCHVEPLNYVLKMSVTSYIIQFAYKSHKEFICSKMFLDKST